MSACDSCPSKSGCTSQSSCPSANGEAKRSSAPSVEPSNANSNIKRVIGVASGKGGVGKSFVTSVLAVLLARKGYKVGVIDADITGPSIPRAFGLKEALVATEENHIIPASTKSGIKAVSLNLLTEDEEAPVVWRGPVISGLVKQFWTDVDWGTLDVLLIDMPPGTGDVPLTVFQSLPIDGIVMVSTPQDLVSMIVSKARNMAAMMNIPVLGLVENMSYIICPHCGDKMSLFGNDEVLEESTRQAGLKILDKLPMDPSSTKLVDSGNVEDINVDILGETVKVIEGLL
ncbi:MAG: Mrp/NBP35 family ATP-binding protein [Saccharofermentans sp.]|nr:Mrp/NBP35 family ATP-binding protein [Saccharofermentans sp.]